MLSSRRLAMVAVNGPLELCQKLAYCLREMGKAGYGSVTLRATLEKPDTIRIHVDGGIYSRVVYVTMAELESVTHILERLTPTVVR